MELVPYAIQEQVVKTVVRSGNGGAVWVPKSWLGEEVIVILPKRPERDVREKILHMLKPYLQDITAVAIFGSYARKEQTKNSDIDVLVVVKDNPLPFTKKENIEIISLSLPALQRAMEKRPEVYYQMVKEAEPVFNAPVFEELKKLPFTGTGVKRFFRETKEHLMSSKRLIEVDQELGMHLTSYSALYSILLRLRNLFIIRCTAREEDFSMQRFKHWLGEQGISRREIEDALTVFHSIRDGRRVKNLSVSITAAEKFLSLLTKELTAEESRV